MGWEIDKTFSFCYGHRVFTQVINPDFTESGHTCAKCRHLHGHEGLVQVFLSGDSLNDQGMVEDFVNLGFVKDFLDENIDHKFIISIDDPWFVNIINATLCMKIDDETQTGIPDHLVTNRPLNTADGHNLNLIPAKVPGTDHVVGYNIDVSELAGPEREFFEGFFLVNFVPTSEELAKWLYEAVQSKMDLINVNVSKISWNETPKSRAVYTPNVTVA